MASVSEAPAMQMLELGVPEFFMNRIGKAEPYGSGSIRFWCCSASGGLLVPQFHCIIPTKDVMNCAQGAINAAAEFYSAGIIGGRLIC
jgi:hypothetical protein